MYAASTFPSRRWMSPCESEPVMGSIDDRSRLDLTSVDRKAVRGRRGWLRKHAVGFPEESRTRDEVKATICSRLSAAPIEPRK
jgi:hypothetical protein